MNVEILPVIHAYRLMVLSELNGLTEAELNIMENYLCKSTNVWLGCVDGELCCILGIMAEHLISDRAYIWFLDLPEFDRYKFVFARRSRDIIEAILGQYPVLIGHCVRSNPSAIRWLKWLGAAFTDVSSEAVLFEIRKS